MMSNDDARFSRQSLLLHTVSIELRTCQTNNSVRQNCRFIQFSIQFSSLNSVLSLQCHEWRPLGNAEADMRQLRTAGLLFKLLKVYPAMPLASRNTSERWPLLRSTAVSYPRLRQARCFSRPILLLLFIQLDVSLTTDVIERGWWRWPLSPQKCSALNQEIANIEFRVPYSQRYLFNAIPDTNHNANPINPNTRYRCEYSTLNSMFALQIYLAMLFSRKIHSCRSTAEIFHQRIQRIWKMGPKLDSRVSKEEKLSLSWKHC